MGRRRCAAGLVEAMRRANRGAGETSRPGMVRELDLHPHLVQSEQFHADVDQALRACAPTSTGRTLADVTHDESCGYRCPGFMAPPHAAFPDVVHRDREEVHRHTDMVSATTATTASALAVASPR